eukprot:9574835-Karenia_brevis.AAC.1
MACSDAFCSDRISQACWHYCGHCRRSRILNVVMEGGRGLWPPVTTPPDVSCCRDHGPDHA